jgi:hypothetical protein
MKHIGWCLNGIQIAFVNMPRDITSDSNKKKAREVIDKVQKYAHTLEDLINNPKFKQLIHKLEQIPIGKVKLQAQKVEEIFKDLEHALQVIELTLKELNEILNIMLMNEEEIIRWRKSYDKLVVMIDQKFGGDRGELRKEFEVSLHTSEQLKEIVRIEEHLAEFLK